MMKTYFFCAVISTPFLYSSVVKAELLCLNSLDDTRPLIRHQVPIWSFIKLQVGSQFAVASQARLKPEESAELALEGLNIVDRYLEYFYEGHSLKRLVERKDAEPVAEALGMKGFLFILLGQFSDAADTFRAGANIESLYDLNSFDNRGNYLLARFLAGAAASELKVFATDLTKKVEAWRAQGRDGPSLQLALSIGVLFKKTVPKKSDSLSGELSKATHIKMRAFLLEQVLKAPNATPELQESIGHILKNLRN